MALLRLKKAHQGAKKSTTTTVIHYSYHFFHVCSWRLRSRFASFFQTIGQFGPQLIMNAQNFFDVLLGCATA